MSHHSTLIQHFRSVLSITCVCVSSFCLNSNSNIHSKCFAKNSNITYGTSQSGKFHQSSSSLLLSSRNQNQNDPNHLPQHLPQHQHQQSQNGKTRTFNTDADIYFRKHGHIPKPISMHVGIEQMIQNDSRTNHGYGTSCTFRNKSMEATVGTESDPDPENVPKNIFIIGDVHGCLDELKELVNQARTEHNNNHPFKCIILVGDLCNKGPKSAEVIQFVKSQKYWYTVRGNHDDSALAAALGDKTKMNRKTYEWVKRSDEEQMRIDNNIDKQSLKVSDASRSTINHMCTAINEGKRDCETKNTSPLSDEDIEWLANLPYTISIPKYFWIDPDLNNDSNKNKEQGTKQQHEDVIVVHAGLIPGIQLEEQEIRTMCTIRDVISAPLETNSDSNVIDVSLESSLKKLKFSYYVKPSNLDNSNGAAEGNIQSWASAWVGPQLVIFGHDAKRGLQFEKNAIGLDTGCTYGKKLTGIILPDRAIVDVHAEKEYCPIKNKKR
mmetsp:Transcript_465/g.649  ORF Transcript_465/g.649 Transcript_465/m.649 type:complete len:494 (-) Transcript_465:131-1612(-)